MRKSVVVAATPAQAFEVFTTRVDRWWPKTHGIGTGLVRESVIEPFVGGRWYASYDNDLQVTTGHVLVWEPGSRLVVTWEIDDQWKPDARPQFTSEVEVRFIAEGASTRVEVEHRNFERMGPGGEKMRNDVDGGWPGLLQLYANEVARP